jgi:hypothetical protein
MLISGGGPDFGPESYLDTVFPVNLSNRRGKLGTQAFASAVVKQLKLNSIQKGDVCSLACKRRSYLRGVYHSDNAQNRSW